MKRVTLAILLLTLICLISCNLPVGNTNPTPTEELYPTLTPVPSTVTVALDGTGNFTTLDEAVKKVKPGATIILSSGTHTLTEKMLIDKELTLRGSGMGKTILSSDIAPVLTIQLLNGNVTLSGISFQYNGSAAGSVVYISTRDRVEITDCEFSGGINDAELNASGVGLSLIANIGTIRTSRFVNNQLDGLEMFGVSTVNIEDCTFSNNGQSGLNTGAGFAGTISGSEFSNNTGSGIVVIDPSTPVIRDNQITNNLESGIVYWFGAAGTVSGNQINSNGLDGISVQEGSLPNISGNTITNNSQAGIFFGNSSMGLAEGNECTGNQWGIYVEEGASPNLGVNNCHDNSYLDIEDRR